MAKEPGLGSALEKNAVLHSVVGSNQSELAKGLEAALCVSGYVEINWWALGYIKAEITGEYNIEH